MLEVSARLFLSLSLGRTRDLDSERRVRVAPSLSLNSDIDLSLLRDRLGDLDLLRGRCSKDLRETKKFGELSDCCTKQDEFEDDGSEPWDEIIVTEGGEDLCILKYLRKMIKNIAFDKEAESFWMINRIAFRSFRMVWTSILRTGSTLYVFKRLRNGMNFKFDRVEREQGGVDTALALAFFLIVPPAPPTAPTRQNSRRISDIAT